MCFVASWTLDALLNVGNVFDVVCVTAKAPYHSETMSGPSASCSVHTISNYSVFYPDLQLLCIFYYHPLFPPCSWANARVQSSW